MTSPSAVLLDEPLASLDVVLKDELVALFRELLRDRAVLYVTHDPRGRPRRSPMSLPSSKRERSSRPAPRGAGVEAGDEVRRARRVYTRCLIASGEDEQLARLWNEVLAEPDDDGPRLVLADLLQTRGDPRGELIALQLAGAQAERCDALITEHGGRWLERQRTIALAAQFLRGFVSRLQLSRDADGADPDDRPSAPSRICRSCRSAPGRSTATSTAAT